MEADHDWNRASKLLCVRLDAMGDVLMTTPAIRALRDSMPAQRITLLTSPAGAAIARLVPEIDDTIIYEAPWMKFTAPRAGSRADLEIIKGLRQERFGGAVIFTVYSQNPLPAAFLCYLADIPLRLGHCRQNPYRLLTHWTLDPEPDRLIRHESRRQLDLVGAIGCRTANERISLKAPRTAVRDVGKLMDSLGVDRERPWLLIHPGATAPSRRYAPEGFARIACELAADCGYQIVFTGSESERDLIRDIQMAAGAATHSLAGCLGLEELVALISLAPVLISNNTGPVHIAAGVGTPVVDLYALTNPQHTPWAVPSRILSHDVPCKYCHKSICPEGHNNCLRLVEPEAVVRATLDLLAETGVRTRGIR